LSVEDCALSMTRIVRYLSSMVVRIELSRTATGLLFPAEKWRRYEAMMRKALAMLYAAYAVQSEFNLGSPHLLIETISPSHDE
jgi:hypothetical protein